jgi:hypothetical protein
VNGKLSRMSVLLLELSTGKASLQFRMPSYRVPVGYDKDIICVMLVQRSIGFYSA